MFALLYALGVLAGLILIIFGANQLVEGSAGYARKVGISPRVIGISLVAIATSLPELVTSVTATLNGNHGIAIGNIVGSNTFNIGIVLGSSLFILRIRPSRMAMLDSTVMITSALLLGFFLIDQNIGRIEAGMLLLGYFLYIAFLIKRSTGTIVLSEEAADRRKASLLFRIGVGMICLIGGAPILVNSAVMISSIMGISETVIGSTLIAAGTSFPELFTSIIAAYKKEGDIAVGNVIGSNIFNILMIVGLSGIISPLSSDALLSVSLIPAMILLSLIGAVVSMGNMGRSQGAILLIGYLAWFALLIL